MPPGCRSVARNYVGRWRPRIEHVVDGVLRQAQDDGADGRRPRVVCLDWLDPLRNTGQWLPEISEMAGGEEGLAIPRGQSRVLSWDEVREYAPEYLMIMPCAFGPERSRQEARDKLTILPGLGGLAGGARRAGLRIRRARAQPPRAAGGGRAGGAGGGAPSRQVRGPGPSRNIRPAALCLNQDLVDFRIGLTQLSKNPLPLEGEG